MLFCGGRKGGGVSVRCWEGVLGDAQQWLACRGKMCGHAGGLLSPIGGMAKAHAQARNGTRAGEGGAQHTRSSAQPSACGSVSRSMSCTCCEIAGHSRGLAWNKRSQDVKIPSARFVGGWAALVQGGREEVCCCKEGGGGEEANHRWCCDLRGCVGGWKGCLLYTQACKREESQDEQE